MRRSLIYLLLFFSFCPSLLHGQDDCAIDFTIPIAPLDTTNLFIDVMGLVNNQLGINNNICGVEINFVHSRLENLRIELVSPSGQTVGLIGPGTINSAVTQPIRWDVSFVPCGFPAIPDPGIQAIWDNGETWNSFTTYEGLYYPNNGCLEDFNTGSANGTWTLRIINVGMFGIGDIESFRLIFCDETGLDCSPCFAHLGPFITETLILCESDLPNIFVGQEFNVEPEFDINTQGFYFLLVQNDQILEFQNFPVINFQLYPAGTYQVCAMVIDSSDISLVPTDYSTLQSLFNQTIICGDLAPNCRDVIIRDTILVNQISSILCDQDTFFYNDLEITKAVDTIVYDVINNICEGTRIILTETDINADLIVSGELGCGGVGSVTLNAINSSSSLANPVNFIWTTSNGNYIVNQGPIAQVDQAGDYLLTVDDSFCQDTINIRIESTGSFQYTLNADTIGCNGTPANIIVNASTTIDSFFWNGPGLLPPISLNPFVDQEGWYIIDAYAGDCLLTDSIFVEENTETPDIMLNIQQANCFFDSASVVILNNVDNYAINIIGPNSYTIEDSIIYFSEAGPYTIEYTDLSNNCSDNENVNIVFDTIPPLAPNFGQLIILCDQDSLVIIHNTSANESLQWFDANGNLLSEEDSVVVYQPGIIELLIVDQNNFCITTESINVIKESFTDVNNIIGERIACDMLLVELCSEIIVPESIFNWTFDGSPISDQACLTVMDTGWYFLDYTVTGSIFLERDSFYVDSLEGFLEIVLDSEAFIPCFQNELTLNAFNSEQGPDISIQWNELTGGNIIGQNGLQITVDGPGTYQLVLTNDLTGCSSNATISVFDQLAYNINIEPPSCDEGFALIYLSGVESNTMYQASINGTPFINDSILVPTGELMFNISNSDCDFVQTLNVDPLNQNDINLPDTINLTLGDSMTLTPQLSFLESTITNISWLSNEDLSCSDCLNPIIGPRNNADFELTITTEDGCIYRASVFVQLVEDVRLYIPNVFSPNSDGINDEFLIGSNSELFTINEWSIYDRWGNLVYFQKNTNLENIQLWDGRFGDRKLSPGVYVYLINYSNPNAENIIRRGQITLVY